MTTEWQLLIISWELPNSTSVWHARDVTHHLISIFWWILDKTPPYSLRGFLGCAQHSSVEPRTLCYLDEAFCRRQHINSLQRCLQHQPQQGLFLSHLQKQLMGGKRVQGEEEEEDENVLWKRSQASTARQAAALAAPTGLCNGTPHNAEQKVPWGQINFKLNVKSWQLCMSRVGRKHRGFHFHVQGTTCLPNSTDSIWGSSFRWQMVIKLLFTLTVDSS